MKVLHLFSNWKFTGPADPAHIQNIMNSLDDGETISHVLVTHTHMDHSPGCALLKDHSDAPTYAFGPHGAGKLEEGTPVEEGGDMDFVPDIEVRHGDVIEGAGWTLEAGFTQYVLCLDTPTSRRRSGIERSC